MAMFHDYSMTRNEIREKFHEAAQRGERYLLLLDQTVESEMLIEASTFTRAVASQTNIVPTLRGLQGDWGRTSLKAVYDLSKNADSELSRSDRETLDMTLSAQTKNEIRGFHAEMDYQRAYRAWQRRPWIQRIFTTGPQKPVIAKNGPKL